VKANVVFATDKRYVPHLATALCSLFENNHDLSIDAFILNADVDQAHLDKLSGLAWRYGQNLVDIKVAKGDLEGLVTNFHFTLANYFRLFIPEKLPFDRALYLDSDVIVNGSIRELYLTDLGDSYLAAVHEPHFKRHVHLEMSADAPYFNSGVMVMNLEKWRRDHIKDRVVEFVRRKPEAILFVDQCGSNAIVNGNWKAVHPRYNLQTAFLEENLSAFTDLYPLEEFEDAIRQPIIIHYTGSAKPWIFRRPHRFRDLYWHYLRKTPFKRFLPEGLSVSRVVKWCLRRAGMAGNHLGGDR
jgi:lipopolysaccharide biosynthesis glycosyltransferase